MSTIQSILPISDRGLDMLKHYMLGGIKLGAGGALATSLLNYLSVLNNKDSSSDDDDTLYIYKNDPEAEEQEKKAGIEGGVAMAALPIGAIGTYALIRKLYSELRMRQAQEELDKSQVAFLGAQGYSATDKPEENEEDNDEVEKAASARKPMNLIEALTSIPFAVPALLGVGTGIVTNKLLNHHFPVAKPKLKGPRRIEIVDKPEKKEKKKKEEEESTVKEASAMSFSETDAKEFLMRMVLCEKRANSDLANIVASVANQGATQFTTLVKSAGFEAALDAVRGAAENRIHPFKEHVATCYLAKAARVSDLVSLAAAVEFAENHPSFMKAAAALSEEKQEALYKVACILGRAFRAEISSDFGIQPPKDTEMSKSAFTEDLLTTLADQVANRVDNDDSSDTSGEEADIKDPDSPSRQRGKKIKFILNGKSAKRMLDGMPSEDIIDKILSPDAPEI